MEKNQKEKRTFRRSKKVISKPNENNWCLRDFYPMNWSEEEWQLWKKKFENIGAVISIPIQKPA